MIRSFADKALHAFLFNAFPGKMFLYSKLRSGDCMLVVDDVKFKTFFTIYDITSRMYVPKLPSDRNVLLSLERPKLYLCTYNQSYIKIRCLMGTKLVEAEVHPSTLIMGDNKKEKAWTTKAKAFCVAHGFPVHDTQKPLHKRQD